MRRKVLAAILAAFAMAAGAPASLAAGKPAVSIRTNKVKALVGEAVTVSWTGSGVTGCSASGAWSGAVANSGLQKLTFQALGVQTLKLTCIAGAAQVSAQVVVRVYPVNTYTHPVDPLATRYSSGYRLLSTRAADVYQDKCAVAPAQISTPRGWLGHYRMPVPTGAPLASGIQRGMGLKDVWQPDNPTFDEACIGKAGTTARAEFTRTALRLKALGVDYVTVTPWTAVGKNADGTWKVWPVSALNTSSMNDDDLTWVVSEAHRIGLKVTWVSQIQQGFNGTNWEAVPASRESATKFMPAYETFLLERAAFLQRIGADTMTVSCQCFMVLESNLFSDIYTPAMARILPKVRKVFKGRIRMLINGATTGQAAIHDSIDEAMIGLYANIIPQEAPTLTLAHLKMKLAESLQGYAGVYKGFDKPVTFVLGTGSRANFYDGGYLEETFCTAGYNVVTSSDSTCIQRDLTTDFSLQAQHLEAYLETIAAQTKFTMRGVEVTDYWLTDSLKAGTTFPNLAFSVRNKPAEGLLKAWFTR